MFWIRATFNNPIDLPDTAGLDWREILIQCLESVVSWSGTKPDPEQPSSTAEKSCDRAAPPAATSEQEPEDKGTELVIAPEVVPQHGSDLEPETPAAEGTETEDWMIDFYGDLLCHDFRYPLKSHFIATSTELSQFSSPIPAMSLGIPCNDIEPQVEPSATPLTLSPLIIPQMSSAKPATSWLFQPSAPLWTVGSGKLWVFASGTPPSSTLGSHRPTITIPWILPPSSPPWTLLLDLLPVVRPLSKPHSASLCHPVASPLLPALHHLLILLFFASRHVLLVSVFLGFQFVFICHVSSLFICCQSSVTMDTNLSSQLFIV
ncbi:hypothetical protein DPX16_18846 [Anabarilius grahami]|uniref:Uncharacterized protein n=1 Tax=Anabarilius grahami TaxID=495550 RepID=A0A3N0Y279_ANAGA|nr:hypothetical protein DPX16_18846 [Anabarilius grahami]